jgi:hypothetical protein
MFGDKRGLRSGPLAKVRHAPIATKFRSAAKNDAMGQERPTGRLILGFGSQTLSSRAGVKRAGKRTFNARQHLRHVNTSFQSSERCSII